ncbi:hypothetical protein H0H92_010291, partial [Tricholoma furcatifolium]
MPPQSAVCCPCCNQWMPPARERQHRRAFIHPYAAATALPKSRLRIIEEMLSDSEPELEDHNDTSNEPPEFSVQPSDSDVHLQAQQQQQRRAWVSDEAEDEDDELYHRRDPTDTTAPESPEEDGEDVNWASFYAYFENVDQLVGEEYERFAADIANKLSEYDLAICRAFAYKFRTHTTDADFEMTSQAFPQNPPLPKLGAIRSRIAFLSGFKPEIYDCCINSCCCFVGPNADLTACQHCSEPRYRSNGKGRKHFVYIPLIPRLIACFADSKSAQALLYRSHHDRDRVPGVTTDVFD